jgi:hypothetical protein
MRHDSLKAKNIARGLICSQVVWQDYKVEGLNLSQRNSARENERYIVGGLINFEIGFTPS